MARGSAGPAEAPLGREHTAPSRCRRAARGHVTRLFRQRPGVHRARATTEAAAPERPRSRPGSNAADHRAAAGGRVAAAKGHARCRHL